MHKIHTGDISLITIIKIYISSLKQAINISTLKVNMSIIYVAAALLS